MPFDVLIRNVDDEIDGRLLDRTESGCKSSVFRIVMFDRPTS